MLQKSLYLLLVLLLNGYLLTAQVYPFIQYTPKDGLVNSRVRNAYQDSKGRMFFMTGNGLSIYDGARFTNYTVDDGLPNPILNDVLELGADSMLLATNTNHLNLWVKGKIKKVATTDGFSPTINKLFRSTDNVIYAAADEGFFMLRNNRFFKVPIVNSMKKEIASSFDNIYEIGDYLLLKHYDPTGQTSKLFWWNKHMAKVTDSIANTYVGGVLPVPANNLLLVLTSHGVQAFDLVAAKKGINKTAALLRGYEALNTHVGKAIMDSRGIIWAGNNSSVLRLTPDGNIITLNKTNGLDVNNISEIYVDRENVLWILTDGSGIIKLVNNNVEYATGLFGKSATGISAIYADPDADTTWLFNYQNNTLYSWNPREVTSWQFYKPLLITNIHRYNNLLYLFTRDTIYAAQPQKSKQKLSVKSIFIKQDISINFDRAIVDTNNCIFIPGKSLTVVRPGHIISQTRLPDFTDQISFDKNNNIWAASRSGDLVCYSVNVHNKNHLLTLKHNFKKAIPATSPRSIVVDAHGKVWMGTRFNGLYCFEFRDTTLVSQLHFTTKEGLTDNFIYYLACDKENNIWACTQSGLDKISFINGKYNIEGVTRNNNIFQLTHRVSIGRYGRVWAMGSGSVIRVSKADNISSGYQPVLQLMRIRTVDTTFEFPGNKLDISPYRNNLSFEVAAPSFIDEKQVKFSYLLQDSETNKWSNPSTQATFNFINLPHGDYSLHVKAFFPVPDYEPRELVYNFTITPPWWKTWWFKAIMLLFGTGVIVFIIRSYYQRKLEKQKMLFEKQKAVEQERTRIAMEMHDDLGSGLTAIRYLAGGLTADSSDKAKDKAVKIESSAKELVDNMNDIIWTMKSDNNTLEETLSYIRKQAAEQLETAAIDYSFDFPKNIPALNITNEQKRNLLLIAKEAVHNILKHAQATEVVLIVRVDGRKLHLSIADNGCGTDLNGTRQFGNGLKNMVRRANEMGGKLEIKSPPGTTITITTGI